MNHSAKFSNVSNNDYNNVNSINSTRKLPDDHPMFAGNPEIEYPIIYNGNSNTIRRVFKCWWCPHIQYDFEDYKKHKIGHEKEFTLKCSICGYSCAKSRSLTAHLKCHTPEYFDRNHAIEKHNSPEMPNLIKESSTLENSGLTITNQVASRPVPRMPLKYRHKCPAVNCPAVYQKPYQLVKHLQSHEISSEYKCQICSYSASRWRNLKLHELKHKLLKSRVYGSNLLAKSRTCMEKAAPPTENVSVFSNSRGMGFMCPECPAQFKNMRDSVRHKKRHTSSGGQHKCSICTFATCAASSLGKHILLHNQIEVLGENSKELPRPLVAGPGPRSRRYLKRCDAAGCPHVFSKRRDQQIHMNLHLMSGKYSCSLCSYSVNKRHHLDGHMLKHKKMQISSTENCSLPFRHRPGWMMMKGQGGFRFRRNLLKHGVVTTDLLESIRKGDPKFNYETTKTYSSGKVVALPYRCLLCPTAFINFKSYQSHQNTHRTSNSSKFKCSRCTFQTSMKHQMLLHCKYHINAEACFVVLTKLSYVDLERWGKQRSEERNSLDNVIGHDSPPREEHIDFTSGEEELFHEVPIQLISQVVIRNFMSIEEKILRLERDSNFLCVLGINGCGRTSVILACLIGLGYDIIANLEESSTICGVLLQNLVQQGKPHGSIETTLEIRNHPDLFQRYGSQVIVRRFFFQELPLSQSEFEISYGNVSRQKITKTDVKNLMNIMFPEFITRFMVLNSENLQYFGEHIEICEKVFWEFAERKRSYTMTRLKELHRQLHHFKEDLKSRQMRMSYLRDDKSEKNHKLDDCSALKLLRKMQSEELGQAIQQCNLMETQMKALEDEKVLLNQQLDKCIQKLAEGIREPFLKFLHSQNYIGDLIVDQSTNQLVVWIKDPNSSSLQPDNPNLEEARHIWKTLTIGRRELAITGLLLGFWNVLDCCPIMFSDGYSSSNLEFSLPKKTWPLILNIIRNAESRLFILATPENTTAEFINSYDDG